MLNHLKLTFEKFKNEMFFKTVSGGRLPIVGKLTISCSYESKDYRLHFLISKYFLPYTILGEKGLGIIRPGRN